MREPWAVLLLFIAAACGKPSDEPNREGQATSADVSASLPSLPSASPTASGSSENDCAWRSRTAGPGSSAVVVSTPFAAPDDQLTFTPPSIPCKLFDITSFGAVGDGVTLGTAAFASAVSAASAAGGGVVSIPAGTWLTGPIHLASNVELHLDANARVLFSQTFADYADLVSTRWEGLDVMNWSPMIYARGASNVAITGTGLLDAQGSVWWPWKGTSAVEDQRIYELALSGAPGATRVSGTEGGLRPAFIECSGCTNLLIEGISTENSPYWTVHPLYSSNVIVRDVHITTNPAGSNGDGINPDSSRNVLIENVLFETSDDCIAIKSGLNEDGIAVARPTENVVIRKIRSLRGHGAVSIGSEMSGGIHNVWVTESDLQGVERPIRIKTMPGRGGTMSSLWFDNLVVGWTLQAIEITTNYGSSTIQPHDPSLLPELRDVRISRVTGMSGAPVYNVEGLASAPFANIVLDSVVLRGAAGRCLNAAGVELRNSSIDGVPAGSSRLPCN